MLLLVGETSLAPRELLAALKAIEEKAGRRGSERWAPRVLDLDILAWEGIELAEAGLEIPHPGLSERAFALLPLTELAPHLMIGGRTAASRARELAAFLIGTGMAVGVELRGPEEMVVETHDAVRLRREVAPLARDRGARLTEVNPLDEDLESVFRYLVGR